MEAAIKLQGIVNRKYNFELGPIDLVIPTGCITAIVGPNGCGKSTTFRMILDLEKPDSGTIELLGQEVGSKSDAELKQRIGYLPEMPYIEDDGVKGSDKASFYKQWYTNWNGSRYRELLKLMDLNDNIKLGKMSKGMRRKFELALALSHAPELLILDEPSSGLDPLAWKTMIEMLHQYMDGGERTILMASHIVDEVKRLADYIVFMADGRILGMYEKDELFRSWQTLFITGEHVTPELIQSMPGQYGFEYAGGTTFKVTTNNAAEAELWREQHGVAILSRQLLTLDEILEALVIKERKGLRFNDARGVKL